MVFEEVMHQHMLLHRSCCEEKHPLVNFILGRTLEAVFCPRITALSEK
jgi:hypothetical protein